MKEKHDLVSIDDVTAAELTNRKETSERKKWARNKPDFDESNLEFRMPQSARDATWRQQSLSQQCWFERLAASASIVASFVVFNAAPDCVALSCVAMWDELSCVPSYCRIRCKKTWTSCCQTNTDETTKDDDSRPTHGDDVDERLLMLIRVSVNDGTGHSPESLTHSPRSHIKRA